MRILIILWFIVMASCIGQPQQKECTPPAIEYTTPDTVTQTEIIFNGVHYLKAEEYTGSTNNLQKISSPIDIYTTKETRNPDTLIVRTDAGLYTFNKDNKEKVIFLEMKKVRNATQIGGRVSIGGHEQGPVTYFFNPDTRTFRGTIKFSLNESLLILGAFCLKRTGDGEVGGTTAVYGIYDFPHTIQDTNILSIDADGTVHLFVYCKYLKISPGESKKVTTSFQNRVGGATYVVEVTYTIYNHGFMPLDNIQAE
ncbi:MAG: hypothetical protein PVF58_10900 [Candidatus Methanofastidiosia archaeon]|jgi:hypothetical protein